MGRAGIAVAAVAAAAAVAGSAALVSGVAFADGAYDVDGDAWLGRLELVGVLHAPDESEAVRAGLENAHFQYATHEAPLVQRLHDVRVEETCDSGSPATRCQATIGPRTREPLEALPPPRNVRSRADAHGPRGDRLPDEPRPRPVTVVTALTSPLLPHPGSDIAVPPQAELSPRVELRTDGEGAWFVLRDGVLIDAATSDAHLTLRDLGARFHAPSSTTGLAALGLLVAVLHLVGAARAARWSRAIARGVPGVLTAEGWLEIPGRDAAFVGAPREVLGAGPVVVFGGAQPAPSYRRAPTGHADFVRGDQAALLAHGDALTRRYLVTALMLAITTSAPFAAAALTLG